MIARLELWLVSWAALGEGLIGVVTLTLWRPNWKLAAAKWLARRRHARKVHV